MFLTTYPIFVIRVDGGYMIISTPEGTDEKPDYAVLLFSEEAIADEFISVAGLEDAEVRFLRDERELAQVLASQPAGVTQVAVDTRLKDGTLTTSCVTIYEVFKKYLKRARSPWDYPVLFLRKKDGNYAAIATDTSVAIAMFTSNQGAKDYRALLPAPSQYALERVESPQQLQDFLTALPQSIAVVAIDPKIDENHTHRATACMEVAKLIEKFLD